MGDELTDPELKSILSIADTVGPPPPAAAAALPPSASPSQSTYTVGQDGDGRVSASEFASLAETLHIVEALKAEVGL